MMLRVQTASFLSLRTQVYWGSPTHAQLQGAQTPTWQSFPQIPCVYNGMNNWELAEPSHSVFCFFFLLTRNYQSGKGQVEIFVPTTYLKQQLKLHLSSRDLKNNRVVPRCITIYLEDVPSEKPEGSDPSRWPHLAASLLPVQLLCQMRFLCQSRLKQIMGLGMQTVTW